VNPRFSRILALMGLVCAAMALGGHFDGHAQAAASFRCFGPPRDYVTAFDGRDGAIDRAVRYPERRMYLELQGWLTPVGQRPGHHSEHMHTGMCFPQGETWAPRVARIHARQTFHNLLGYRVTRIRGGAVDTGLGGLIRRPGAIARLNRAARASAGTTRHVYQTYRLNIPAANCSGRAESRIGMRVVRSNSRALVAKWFTSTGWQSYMPPGKPRCTSGRDRDVVISSNWVPGFEYAKNGLGPAPVRASTWRRPKARRFVLRVGMASGVTRGSLHIDPDFHHHPDDPGLFYRAYRSPRWFRVRVRSGLHRAVNLGHEGGGSRITSTVVTVLPVRVR
jgi:hypothetical protein